MERDPSIPLVIVTGSINEETAVECMKAGAWDYVIKENLIRLPQSVEGALENKRMKEEKERTAEGLRESEKKYRSIFDNVQVGIFRSSIKDGKILECNDRLAQIFAYGSREEYLDKFVSSEHYIDAGTRERMLEQIQKDGEIDNFEARMSRNDGSIIWVLYSAKLYPEWGYLEGVTTEITEQKQAKEALRESETQVRILLDSTAEAIYGLDKNGKCTFANPSCVGRLGYKSIDDLIGGKYAPSHSSFIC